MLGRCHGLSSPFNALLSRSPSLRFLLISGWQSKLSFLLGTILWLAIKAAILGFYIFVRMRFVAHPDLFVGWRGKLLEARRRAVRALIRKLHAFLIPA